MVNKNNIFIIIVTYNSMKWIERCLSSCVGYQVVIVDNCSSDKTVVFIEENFPEIILIKKNKNLGFGQANNLGISYAFNNNGKGVFLLNQDAYLEKDTIEIILKIYNENLEYGILSPIHLNGNANKLDRKFSNYIGFDKNNFFYFDAIKNQLKSIYQVPFVNAAAWFLPQKTIEIIGGFDPIFFHYGEDDNYCQRVLFHKLKIGVVTNSFIYHDRETIRNKKKSIERNYKLIEAGYKSDWANLLNFNYKNDIIKQKRKIIKNGLKFIFLFKIKKIKEVFVELKMISKIKKEIEISRKLNVTKCKNYLN